MTQGRRKCPYQDRDIGTESAYTASRLWASVWVPVLSVAEVGPKKALPSIREILLIL